jgi:multiple sugar transport system substrate-binding protein
MNLRTASFLAVILYALWLTGCVPATPTATTAAKIQIRLLLGGTCCASEKEASGKTAIEAVMDDFNASQDTINLSLMPLDGDVKTTLTAGFASGNGPDIVGALSSSQADLLSDQWLDLSPLIQSATYDLKQFPASLVNMYKTPNGQIALPFGVNPSVVFYNTQLFDQAGLNYPPARYGATYTMADGTQVEWNWDTLRDIARILTVDANGMNSTQAGFDRNQIRQYGFTWQYENHPAYWGSYWDSGSLLAPGGSKGKYLAQIPDAWKAAWKWTYDAIWGGQPFMANAAVESSAEYSSGNPFNSNRVAMTVQPTWLTCCVANVQSWDLAALPAYHSKVGGRIDEISFRIWKGSPHPQEAFDVLAYLVGEGNRQLLFGSKEIPQMYDAMPARIADQSDWVDIQKAIFPNVKNWSVVLDDLNYPDIPSADEYMPNYNMARIRGIKFADLLRGTGELDLDAEMEKYKDDLTTIFNQ